MTKLSADAVVIGGGAAGMMCSLIAARRGLDVILLEQNARTQAAHNRQGALQRDK